MPDLNKSLAESRALADAPTLGNLHPDARAQAIARAARVDGDEMAARLAWLHSPASNNVDGYEWGIFRVKWENGRAVEVWHTNGDFSDLDAARGVAEAHSPEPEFTNTARAALLWVLWHHQGGSSPVGQPIRFALGMGQHDRLSAEQVRQAKAWDALVSERQRAAADAEAPREGQERAAFEAWMVTQLGGPPTPDGGGGYALHEVRWAWMAWKAARGVQGTQGDQHGR